MDELLALLHLVVEQADGTARAHRSAGLQYRLGSADVEALHRLVALLSLHRTPRDSVL